MSGSFHVSDSELYFGSPRCSDFAYFVFCISHFVHPSPLVGAIKFGGRSPAGTIFFYFAPNCAGRNEIEAAPQ